MSTYSLDELRSEIERKYAPVSIELNEYEKVVLRNLLRLPRRDRADVFVLMDALDALDNSDADRGADYLQEAADLAAQVLILVADSRHLGEKLIALIGDDLALTLRIFEDWMKATQPGEAESSLS